MGSHTIELHSDSNNGQNIILIGGVNGAGKTSLLKAIRLCIFGKHFKGKPISLNKYNRTIISSKNKMSEKEGDDRYFVQVELEINESYPNYLLSLEREWILDGNGKVTENFSIFRDEEPLEIIPKEYWEDYILSVIPPFLSDYFFFDGEKVKKLSIGDNADKILRESIKDVIGLNLYKTLEKDLTSLNNKIRRRNISQEKVLKAIGKTESEIAILEESIEKLDKNITKNLVKIDDLSQEIKDIEAQLRRKAGAYAKDKKKNEATLLELRQQMNSFEDKIKQICEEVLPFLIASNLCNDVVKQIKSERRLKELIASKNILNEVNKKLVDRIKKSISLKKGLSKDKQSIISEEINGIFSGIRHELQSDPKDRIIHDLSNPEMEVIETFLNRVKKGIKRNFNKQLKEREIILQEIKRIDQTLKMAPDEIFVKEYINKISSIRTQIDVLKNENSRLKDKLDANYSMQIKLQDLLAKAESRIVVIEEDERKIDISCRIQGVLDQFGDIIISYRIKELGAVITEMYKLLANKDDMIDRIEIDDETFNTKLIGYNGEEIDKKDISSGEREVYALSVLWGLSKISKKQLPFIIDSPLGRLDSTHVNNILTKFFPNAGEQVIILPHDREINKKDYMKIKSRVKKSYVISKNYKDQKIKEGYFFEV